MQHLLVSVSDATNLVDIQTLLLQTKGIERVEPLDTESDLEDEADWKNNLHKPGPKLTEAQLEELVDDMDNEEDEGISQEELDAKLNAHFLVKGGVKLI